MHHKKSFTVKEAKIKAASFCAYRERTQQEVRDKLYSYGLHSNEVEEVIALLITENFISEERFSKAYAGGKFRINHWGRNKIKAGLQLKGISARCQEYALSEIDEEEYKHTMEVLLVKKIDQLKHNEPFIIRNKVANFLIGKGFEPDLVWERIRAKLDSVN